MLTDALSFQKRTRSRRPLLPTHAFMFQVVLPRVLGWHRWFAVQLGTICAYPELRNKRGQDLFMSNHISNGYLPALCYLCYPKKCFQVLGPSCCFIFMQSTQLEQDTTKPCKHQSPNHQTKSKLCKTNQNTTKNQSNQRHNTKEITKNSLSSTPLGLPNPTDVSVEKLMDLSKTPCVCLQKLLERGYAVNGFKNQ